MRVAAGAAPLLAAMVLAGLAQGTAPASASEPPPPSEISLAPAPPAPPRADQEAEPRLRPSDLASAEPPPPDSPDTAATAAAEPLTGTLAAEAPGADLVLPEPPAAEVFVGPSELLQGAIALRLGDPRRPGAARLPRKERDALAAFYARQGHRPLWIADGAWTSAARAVAARLAAAREDGLDPADYAVPSPASGAAVADLAEAELGLSASAVLYARDARGARLDLARIGALVTPKLDLPAADAVLQRLAASGDDAGTALAAYNPQHPGYRALKAKLAQLRAYRPVAQPAPVPHGPMVTVGMRDPRVPLVRARFGLGPAAGDTVYDERLAAAVAAFQRQKGLVPSGVLTRQTVIALSPRPARPAGSEADLVANMERWRWLPAELGERHVFVNVPEYRVRVVEEGRVAHEARVIVGKPETPTPLFSATMEYAVVNPSWNVPPSILRNEFLPKLAKDPFYAARLGYQVVRKGNSIAIRQPPGERNALGHIKFMFPNHHAVYLHDTPNRNLFSAARRTFSHGCVRVDQPMQLAEVLLRPRWSADRVRAMVGRGERTLHLPRSLPVHLGYFTTYVDERGDLRSAEDVYGYNRKVRAALGLEG